MSHKLHFTLLGQPFSKANRRRNITDPKTGKSRSIKSPEALAFERSALLQVPSYARLMIDSPCGIRLRIFYTSERPDLDESVVLDCLQARYQTVSRGDGPKERVLLQRGVVTNDRLFRQRHCYHGIDKKNPRVEITVWRLDGQLDLFPSHFPTPPALPQPI
jgi:hypothetical protein